MHPLATARLAPGIVPVRWWANLMDLHPTAKVVVITGASTGIGRATALMLSL
jgi:hypothetical protein